MTFEKKWDYFNRHAKFNSRLKWVQIALSFIKNNALSGTVDFSFKNINNNIYFNRLNIKFRDNPKLHYEQWYRDILEIGKCWKISWPDKDIRSFFNNLDWSMCTSFYGGFDLRSKIEKSRLKFWCAFSSDKKTIQKLIKYCPFDKDHLAPYWRKYASERIFFGWVYNGNGDVSWRVYPEIPAGPFVLGSKNHVVRKLGPLSGMLASIWPATQPLIYWGNINNKELFIRELASLLYSDQAIDLAKNFQEQGLILSSVCAPLPATKKEKITEANFYFR